MFKIATCDGEVNDLKRIENLLKRILDSNGVSIYKIDIYLSGKDFSGHGV